CEEELLKGTHAVHGRFLASPFRPCPWRARVSVVFVARSAQRSTDAASREQKDKVGRPDIDAFEAMMMRTDRTKGFYVSFAYSSDAEAEIDAFFRKTGKVIVPLKVTDILNERLAHKLA